MANPIYLGECEVALYNVIRKAFPFVYCAEINKSGDMVLVCRDDVPEKFVNRALHDLSAYSDKDAKDYLRGIMSESEFVRILRG